MRHLLLGYRSLMEDGLREAGLTLPQLRLLRAVEQKTGVSAAALARMCHVTPQTMQAVLTRAVRERWIVRGRSDRNERIVTASLTRQGRSVLERGMRMAARIEEELWRGIPVADLKRLNALLEAGVANLDERMGAAQGGEEA